jgi:hypothetical protein
LPRGNAELTDKILIQKITRLDRPVTINDLGRRLKWSRGKIDGSIVRLSEKQLIAIVNISIPKGQRIRYVGLPGKSYWKIFYEQLIVKEKYVLIYDTLGVLQPYRAEISGHLQTTLSDHDKQLIGKDFDELSDTLPSKFSKIDTGILEVIEENLDRIISAAKNKKVTPSELLKDRILDITNPNFDIFIRITSIVTEEAQSDKDTIERSVARSFLRRARSLNHL